MWRNLFSRISEWSEKKSNMGHLADNPAPLSQEIATSLRSSR